MICSHAQPVAPADGARLRRRTSLTRCACSARLSSNVRPMKRSVEKISEAELLRSFPIAGRVPGWFFRVGETSNLAWLAEGSDCWGRLVSSRGSDDAEALE